MFSHLRFHLLASLICFSWQIPAAAEEEYPLAKIQFPDIATFPDRTDDFQKQIDDNNGTLILPAGVHRITRTLLFDLQQKRSALIQPADGPVTLIMDGPGPAILIRGSHEGTASPKTVLPATWNERSPTVKGIEIVGNHPEADGVALEKCFAPIVTEVSVRWCRHGIHLINRNRNLIISDCNFYENSGVGVFYDHLSLHQSNITNCHISYNRQGGIVIRNGNVRNVQIANCDIEGNMPGDDTPTAAANILVDVSDTPEDKSHSVAEMAITGCTIQHSSNYSPEAGKAVAPGGANIRLLGKEIWPIDSVTITGNVVSDTSLNMEFSHCTDITLTGNTFFAPGPDNLRIADSERIIVNGNTFNPRQFQRPGRIFMEKSKDCQVSNNIFRALEAEDGALQINNCERILLSGNILTDCLSGAIVTDSKQIRFLNWNVSGLPEGKPLYTSTNSEVSE